MDADGILWISRTHSHKLAGILTGISAATYCCRIMAEKPEQIECLENLNKLIVDAQEELSWLASTLREMSGEQKISEFN